jgi:hypothetical protein
MERMTRGAICCRREGQCTEERGFESFASLELEMAETSMSKVTSGDGDTEKGGLSH